MPISNDKAAITSMKFEKSAPTTAIPPHHHNALFSHGGNLQAAQALFPNAPQPWIDLSTGVNPFSYPLPSISVSAWTQLPSPEQINSLEQAAADFYCSPRNNVIAAAGSQALIQLIPSILQHATDIRIFGFTYTGHARAWEAYGKIVKNVSTLSELAGADVAIIVNPNNPDGHLVQTSQLLELKHHLRAKGGTLIIDEAFMDFSDPTNSLIPVMPEQGTIVLRSFGKAFGLAGLRLGFALCSQDMEEKLRAVVGSWAVSGAAIEIGRAALCDQDWLSSMRFKLQERAVKLDRLLVKHGFNILGGTVLFRLAEHKEAAKLFTYLAKQGILVRPFAQMETYLRFGIAADHQWSRLEQSLADFSRNL